MTNRIAAQVAASAAPYVEAVTFCIEDGAARAYLRMTDDTNGAPFTNVVEILPGLAERLDTDIRAAGGSLYVLLSAADYEDGEPESDGPTLVVVERAAPGGSPH